MTQKYRNHPIVLLRSVLITAFILLLSTWGAPWFVPVAIVAVMAVISVFPWYLTTFTLYDDHALVEVTFISKRRTIVPYGKVASVNTVRTILGRIAGCTTIQININSSMNAARPDVSFTLRDDIVAELVPLLKYGTGISGDAPETASEEDVGDGESAADEEPGEIVGKDVREDVPVFQFGFASAIIFGLVGSSTWSLIMSTLWGFITVFSMFADPAVSLMTLFMFIFTGIVPIVSSILKHGNFRVYRSGTVIRMYYGMTTIFDTSFDVGKVNAVCVKRAFFPRLAHMCCLQAEVVGINADEKSTTPNVTLLIPESRLDYAMRSLFPEFITDYDVPKQPKGAEYPTFSMPTYVSLGYLACLFVAYQVIDALYGNASDYLYAFIAADIAVPLVLFVRGFYALRIRRMGHGETMFTSVNGILDTSEYTMQYSKVQISDCVASPRCRKHGLVKMHVSLLSAQGEKRVTTGFFTEEEAEEISRRTVELSGHQLVKKDVSTDYSTVLT